jgi:hypothetical protein
LQCLTLGASNLHGKGIFIVTNFAFRGLSVAVLVCSFLSPVGAVTAHAASQNNIAKFKSHLPQCAQRKGNRATTACLCSEYNRQVQSHQSAKSGAMSQMCGGEPEAIGQGHNHGDSDTAEVEVVNNSRQLNGARPQGEIQNPSDSSSPDGTSDETEDSPETEGSSADSSVASTTSSESNPDSGDEDSGDSSGTETPDTPPVAVQ